MNNIEKSHSLMKINPKLEFIYVNTISSLIESSNLSNSYCVYENNKIIEEGSLSNLEQIKILMDSGLNPFTPLKDSYTIYAYTIFMTATRHENTKALDLLVDYINKEHLQSLPQHVLHTNVEAIIEFNNKYIEQLFEKGFILKQPEKENISGLAGKFMKNGNLAFFEALYYYQPEFDFNKKYLDEDNKIEKTLLEYIKESIELENKYDPNGELYYKLKNLENFIQSVSLHTEIEKNTPEKRKEIIKKGKI